MQSVISRPKFVCLWLIAALAMPTAQLAAQSKGSQSFASIMSYATTFEELQRDSEELLATQRRLIQQRDDAHARLQQSEKDLGQVKSAEVMGAMRLWEANMQLQLLQLDFAVLSSQSTLRDSASSDPLLQNRRPSSTGTIESGRVLSGNIQQQQFRTVQSINLGEQFKQLDLASRLVVERRQKILNGLEETNRQAQQWFVDQRKLYDRYLDQADIAGVRSQVQLKSALRELERADPDNLSARVVRAITLVRLERLDEAEPLMEELVRSPTIARPVAIALKAEVLARRGETKEAQKQLKELLKLKEIPSQAIWLHAQVAQLLNDPSQAVRQWNSLLQSGSNEVAAHRGLALCYCTFRQRSSNQKRVYREALEHAELANRLTGDSDWSCQIALALATAISGDLDQAATLAETAADSALLEKQTLCLAFAQELRDGSIPVWEF
ncbi:MAG: hypothetical protein IT422_16915 [Pirellulaceae bacterium]|nr:hypothetical protein [Pirellulaceae bacterium]